MLQLLAASRLSLVGKVPAWEADDPGLTLLIFISFSNLKKSEKVGKERLQDGRYYNHTLLLFPTFLS